MGFAAGAAAGAATAAGAPSGAAGSGAASSAALTTSLEPAFLIGKKDTEFLDDEDPAATVTLAGKRNTEDADIIAICRVFFLFCCFLLFLPTRKSEFLIRNMLERLRKEGVVVVFWIKRIVSLHLISATCHYISVLKDNVMTCNFDTFSYFGCFLRSRNEKSKKESHEGKKN